MASTRETRWTPFETATARTWSAVVELVAALRAAAPAIPRSILFTGNWRERPRAMSQAGHELGAAYAHPCFRPIEPSLVDAFHAAGLMVMTPHTNDLTEALYFATIGVDVIASDDPRVLIPLHAITIS